MIFMKTSTNETTPPPLHETSGDDEFLTRKEVAFRLKQNVRTVDKWHRRGTLPKIKIGRSVLYKWSDVQSHIINNHRLSRRCTPLPAVMPAAGRSELQPLTQTTNE